eukprot:scaffold5497_cov135-Cylindrotheca_fusiformis.AAC.3
MVDRSVVLCEVIGKVGAAGFPEDVELSLGDAVADPVVSHVDVASLVLFDGVVGDTRGGGVVSLDGRGGLRMVHVEKCLAEDQGLFQIDKQSTTLGFGSGAGDVAQDADGVENGAVGRDGIRLGIAVSEVEMASNAAAGFAGVEIAGVAMALEDHVGGGEAERSIGIGGAVVEDAFGVLLGEAGGMGLAGCNVTEGDE